MPKHFDRLYFFYNTRSTNYKRSRDLFESLKKIFPKSGVREYELKDIGTAKSKARLEKIAANFNKSSLVAIGGGDGSVNYIIETVLDSPNLTASNKSLTFFPIWGGNANDMAVMLNGHVKNITELRKTFDTAKIVKIHPLKVSFNSPTQEEFHRLAFGYASFGITAHAIQRMEQSSKNINTKILSNMPFRLIPEAMDFFKAFKLADPFVVKNKSKTELVSERIFINGSRVAKIERFPIKLNAKEYYVASSSKKKFYLNAAKAMLRPNPKNIKKRSTSFVIADDTLCQVDGETIKIDHGTRVKVGFNSIPFSTLSNKLRN